MSSTAILIGRPENCFRLEQQLNLLEQRPVTIGWVLIDDSERSECDPDDPVLGCINQLEAILAHRTPGLALVSLPGRFADLIQSIRTRLRRLGVPDRFMPTLEDQIAGVGPRSLFTLDLDDLLDREPRLIDEDSIRDLLRGRRVLITGAGGSIGSELSRLCARFEPQALYLVERSENALFEIDRQIARFHPDLGRRAILHDVVRASATRDLFAEIEPEIIFHAAAHKHVPMMEDHPAQAVDNNLFGTKSVADAAVACSAERFVLISSDKAVNPSSIMGATKRLAEMYVQHLHPRAQTGFSMVRFGNVLGSSGSVLEVWSKQLAEGGPITVTHEEMTRYFMTIPEAARLVVQAAALSEPNAPDAEVFVLDMGDPVRIADLADRFVEQHGLRPVRGVRGASRGDIRIVVTAARPGEKLHEELARDSDLLVPTRHPDIQIWQVRNPEPGEMEGILKRLDPTRRPGSGDVLAASIRAFVPETVRPVAA